MKINMNKFISDEVRNFEIRVFQQDLKPEENDLEGTITEDGALVCGFLQKRAQNEYQLEFSLDAVIVYPCARCLTPTEMKSHFTFEEQIVTEEDSIDLIEYICECLYINEPYRVLCEDDCKGLCPSCGVNLNHEKCNCDDSREIDPRLESLKTLLK